MHRISLILDAMKSLSRKANAEGKRDNESQWDLRCVQGGRGGVRGKISRISVSEFKTGMTQTAKIGYSICNVESSNASPALLRPVVQLARMLVAG